MSLNNFFLCGGAVRDELLGGKTKDHDYVVLVNSFDEMRAEILKNGGEIFIEKPEYQVIRGHLPNIGAADFALPRKDGNYSDGRRPDTTEIAETLYEDSCRRDFTINAMYKNVETGEIIDYHNGRRDLENGIIRCVGSAGDRIMEDSLRLLRAIRFSITKDFSFDMDIYYCLNNDFYTNLLINVSPERIREELFKCFRFDTLETLNILRDYPLIRCQIFNERTKLWLKPTSEER